MVESTKRIVDHLLYIFPSPFPRFKKTSYLCGQFSKISTNMKKNIIITALLATLTMGAAAQGTDSKTENVCQSDTTSSQAVDLPSVPGGKEELTKYLSKNVKYPTLAEQYDVEGKVVIHFFVDANGSVKDITASDCTIERFNTTKFSQETEVRQKKLKEKFALLFAKEGARVVRKMPKWTPGLVNGKIAGSKCSLPIRFSNPNK